MGRNDNVYFINYKNSVQGTGGVGSVSRDIVESHPNIHFVFWDGSEADRSNDLGIQILPQLHKTVHKAKAYTPTEEQSKILIDTAKLVKTSGYCRIDAVGGNEAFAIIEINPLARIDADNYGFDVARAILEYAIKLNHRSTNEI